jgi:hypothetical protein
MSKAPVMTLPLHRAGSDVAVEESTLDVHALTLPDQEIESQLVKSRAESAEPGLRRDAAWRHERVATSAYYLAAKRGFESGHEAEDWSLAELQTDMIDEGRRL